MKYLPYILITLVLIVIAILILKGSNQQNPKSTDLVRKNFKLDIKKGEE